MTFLLTHYQVYMLNFLELVLKVKRRKKGCKRRQTGRVEIRSGVSRQVKTVCVFGGWGVLTCIATTICSRSWPSLNRRHWQDGHFSEATLSSIIIRLQPSGQRPEPGVMSSFMTLKYKQMIVHWSAYHQCLWTFLKLLSFSLPLFFISIQDSSGNFAPKDWRQNLVDPSGKSFSE